ncbi:MAG: hypothetical protein K2X36_01875, partial [Microbacteriaceae bacterium]|nr:hypothetical protein [Microbacteriaceae bacterium]
MQGMFGAASSLGYNKKGAAHDIYEGFVLTLLLKAADNLLWKWQLRDGNGNPTSHVLFRLGPGRLPSSKFTHILLTKQGKADLEAHIGVKVIGKALYSKTKKKTSSSVVHEFDLLVLRSAVANYCRGMGHDPHHSHVVMHAEAKYY